MAVQVELGFLVDHTVSSPAEHPQTSSSCLGPEPKKDRPTTARMGQQAAASIRNWILVTRCMGNSSGEKLRNGHRTNLERFKKALELPRTASEGSQKGPGTKLASPPLPSLPLPPTHTPSGASGSKAHLLPHWMVSRHQKGEGGGAGEMGGSTSGHK